MTKAARAAVLTPLDAAAAGLDAAGRGPAAPDRAVYAGVSLDPAYDGVDLYLTDTSKSAQVIADAQRLAPGFDSTLVKVFPARYTRDQEQAAEDALTAQANANTLPYKWSAMVADPKGTGVTVQVDNVAAAQDHYRTHPQIATPAATADSPRPTTVPLSFQHGDPAQSATWSDTKWHDHAPFIGGDVLTDNGDGYCTAGIGAVNNSTGEDVLTTAGHCFGYTNVYTGGGTTGSFYNGQTGGYVGHMDDHSTRWDTEILDQGSTNSSPKNNADFSMDTGWLPFNNGVAYSYNGDIVCQDGAVTFFSGHHEPCNIVVQNQNVTYSIKDQWGTHTVQGVQGCEQGTSDNSNGWGVAQGDSGAPVYAESGASNGYYQVRGQVSAVVPNGYAWTFHGQPNLWSQCLYWTEAPDFLGHFNLSLNPLT